MADPVAPAHPALIVLDWLSNGFDGDAEGLHTSVVDDPGQDSVLAVESHIKSDAHAVPGIVTGCAWLGVPTRKTAAVANPASAPASERDIPMGFIPDS